MVHGPLLFLIILLGVGFIVLATAKWKLHPFLALLIASFGVGIAAGMPLADVVKAVNDGFGGLMSSIGIVILAGTVIGTILEKSGAALRMAEVVLRLVGEKRPQLAMSLIGAIVSIPVFCDSGYVILSSLNKALAKRTNVALASMSVALATGLYATHTLVPPTPGPIAAAGNIGASNYLGTIIIIGLIVAIPVILVGYIWAIKVASKIHIQGEEDHHFNYDEVVKQFGNLPSTGKAFAPIVIPILFIGVASIISSLGWTGQFPNFFLFLGTPVVALLIGVFVSFTLLPKWNEETLTGWVGEGIKDSATIILITGAGGAFGSVIKTTPVADLIKGLADGGLLSGAFVLLIPFIVAAALKTAQGSSTAALVITSALIAPMIKQMGMDGAIPLALVVMAVGAGAMAVSHVNDSYFWVVTQFSGMKVTEAYKAQTMATLLQGVTAIIVTMILWVILV
ncbi:GntP family permease [Paenactinomyces guangxiensis]|uniref:GntP family permease n=1 Tax=Paenactinomyces guangxiensis TaxID=1490290 RepID=A0A7W1WSJ2_9BACL|nr:GntP family permease [Paenactinomyces guangxiensis]MBA4495193.1 GntP family permease [Paenactinomyces guangxiensis]MBH8592277.1 GntP family permease [Paenactinomyces guangxiensis]